MNEENTVMFCPKCNSTDIRMDNSNPLIGVAGVPADYVCTNCGYTARVFPALEESEAKKLVEKKVMDNTTEKVDVQYGKFAINIWWKIFGPLAILIGIYMLITYDNTQRQFIILPIILIVLGAAVSYFGYKNKNDKIKRS